MKRINLFNKELTFGNEELEEAARMAVRMGYKVHTFKGIGCYIEQIFVENDNTFGSISTCHNSVRGSNNGSGFGMTNDPQLITEKLVNLCFAFAPVWATHTDQLKKETWAEYLERDHILEYGEMTEQLVENTALEDVSKIVVISNIQAMHEVIGDDVPSFEDLNIKGYQELHFMQCELVNAYNKSVAP